MKCVWPTKSFKLTAVVLLLMLTAACRPAENTPTPPLTRTSEPTKSSVPTTTTAPTLTPSIVPPPTTKPADEPLPVKNDPEAILDIQWQWLAFKDAAGNNEISVDDPEQFTLTLHPNGSAAVQTECNQVSLGYVLDGSDISFSAIGPATTAYCGEDSLDELYRNLLVDAATWAMNDEGQLILNSNSDSGHLIFEDGETAPPPEQPDTAETDIIGRTWEWQAFLDTAGIDDVVVEGPERYSLVLQPDGHAYVLADCNELAWSYELKGSQLSFDASETGTLTDCGEDSLDQRFLTLLSNVAEWFPLDGGTLYLNLWADGGSMVFGPAPGEAILGDQSPETTCSNAWFMADGSDWAFQDSTGKLPPSDCAEGSPLHTFAATQSFENGRMIWLEETDAFYILFNEGADPFDSRQTFITLDSLPLKPDASADNRVGEEPPTGLVEPVSGFGHIWRGEIEGFDFNFRQALGWGLAPELGFDTVFQCQEQKTYSERTCYFLDNKGSVITLSGHAIAGNIWWESADSR